MTSRTGGKPARPAGGGPETAAVADLAQMFAPPIAGQPPAMREGFGPVVIGASSGIGRIDAWVNVAAVSALDGGWNGRRRTALRRVASAGLVGVGVAAAVPLRR
jgi:hypothetical protein